MLCLKFSIELGNYGLRAFSSLQPLEAEFWTQEKELHATLISMKNWKIYIGRIPKALIDREASSHKAFSM